MRGRQWLVVMVGVGLLSVAADTSAQTVEARDTIGLSLEEALDRSMERSEEVRIAAAQVDRAGAEVGVARSNLLPQVNTQLGYTRTLRSVFQGGGFEIPDSMRFEPDSTASIAQRLRYLEQNVPNAAFQSLGSLFSGLPFGQEHTWNAAATLQQALFAPAAVSGVQLANRAEEAARASYEEAVSDVTLDVAEAYLGAALAEQTAEIVEASVELAAAHLAQVRLQFDAGVASELDVLRAEVELENLRPQLAQANNGRDLAIANLKRLVNIPAQVEVRQVAVQGTETVAQVTAALRELDALAEVDVIVVARGGGSFEDLLPFSNETLVRAVAATRTPVVSAIGHESDTPLLDFVADLRASTPTHAAAAVVPDVADELRGLVTVRGRSRRAVAARIRAERERLEALLSRPVMTDRAAIITRHRDEVADLVQRGRGRLAERLVRERDRSHQLLRHLRAVSPQHTLERGYAVVRHADGRIVRDRAEVDADELLRVTVAEGDFAVRPVSG